MTVGGLHASVQRRIDALLDDAEASRTIVVASHGDADALKRRASRGQLASPAKNLYARDAYWSGLDPAERALHLMRAEASRHPTWRFRSYSAALVWGLDVPHALVDALHIIADRPPNAPHCRARRPSSRDDYALRDGMNVTSFWQTVAECLCEAPFSYGLAIADSALHMRGTTNEELLDRLSIADDRTGIAQARLIASCADERAENGGESRVRAYLIAQGYQIPELQVEFPNPTDPAHPYRVDFFWGLIGPRGTIGEFDGMGKYRDPQLLNGRTTIEVLVAERQRESRLTLLGHPVLRFTYQDLLHPIRLSRALESAGIPRDHVEARRWHDAWDQVKRH